MKTLKKKGFALLVVIAATVSMAFSQAYLTNPKYGADEPTRIECATSISLYREAFNQRNFADARKPWKKVIAICPAATQNAYINGIQMLKFWIEGEANPTRKTELLDSLMMVYDLRIENFNRRGFLLGQKGMDLFQFDPQRYEEAYSFLKESIELEKAESSTSAVFTYMALTKAMYDNRKIEADKVIETYSLLSDYIDAMIAAKPEDDKLPQAKESVDAIFSQAGVANCENLVQIFEPRVKANPNDAELAKKVYNLLKASRCSDAPMYKTVASVVFKNEPSASLALELSRISLNNKEIKNAEKYYQDAIKLETDSMKKSNNLYEYADYIVFRENNNLQQARSLALQAIDLNPNFGKAYILIGYLYASEKNCGDDAFAKSTIYWAVVDKFIKAKQVDPSVAADADKQIEAYVKYFPAQSDIFFQDLQPGASYTVGCWINERTTIRGRQ